ncbi:MAG: translocation/assembly module TamB domain-containing protein, partial [Polyangiaceae bacterium]
VSGRVSLRGADLGALARILGPSGTESGTLPAARGALAVGGQAWGEVIIDDLPIDAPAKLRARLFLGPTFVSRGSERIAIEPPREPIVVADDVLSMPPLKAMLEAHAGPVGAGDGGFRGGFVLSGGMTKLTSDPRLDFKAELDPIDLTVLQRLIPKVQRASGRLEGGFRVTGSILAPKIAGELHARGDGIKVRGLPSPFTDVSVDATATSSGLSGSGSAKFAGGSVSFRAAMPLRGLDVGTLHSSVTVRGVSVAPVDGVKATCDADLVVTYDPKADGGGTDALPHVTGDVMIGSLSYTRPITMSANLPSFATHAKRTVVDAYDPSLDILALNLRVLSRAPIVIKNNLIEVKLAMDPGGLNVTGTNQLLGLRGALRTLPGGRIHFQTSEFEVRQGLIRFDDATRIVPNVDVTAVTEYRRYTDTSSAAAAGAASTGGSAAASAGATRGGSLWRITLRAYGDADDLRVQMTSEPALSQEDIVLLLTVGMTRAELDQLGASSIGASIALNYLGAASGADRAVKQALPIIDDFRFGSAYSTVTGKTEPQLTVGKRLTNDLRASVTAGLSEDRELQSNIEWRLNNRLSVRGSYDNINDISSSALGNLGMDLRWRLEFE